MSLAKIYGVAYLAFFAAFSIGYTSKIVDPVQLPRLIILSLFLAVLLFLTWKDSQKKRFLSFAFIREPLPLIMTGMSVLIAVSFFSALLKFETLFVLARSLSALLYFFLTAALIRAKKLDMNTMAKAIGLFAGVVLLIALYQVALDPGNPNVVVSTMANKNLLASILFLSLPFVLWNLKGSTVWNIASILTLIGSLIILFATEARGASLATLVFLGIIIIGFRFFLKDHDPAPKLTNIAFFTILVILLGGGIAVAQNQDKFTQLFDATTLSERKVLWTNTAAMIKDQPLTGVGAGNWKVHNSAYGLEGFQEKAGTGLEIFQRPHNDFLWVFSELGIVGFLLYLGLFTTAIILALKGIRRARDKETVRLHLLLLAAIAGYIIIALFGYPFERVEQQIYLATFFAFLVGLSASHSVEKKPEKTPKALWALGIVIVFSTAYLYLQRYDGEVHTARLYAAKLRQNWPAVIKEADAAINPLYHLDASSTPILWYKGVAHFAQNDWDKALNIFNKALEIAPNDIHVLTNIATGYANAGKLDEAEKYFTRTIAIAPAYANPRINMCKLRFQQDEFDEAFAFIEPLPLDLNEPNYKELLPIILKKKSEKVTGLLRDQAKISRINARITSRPAIVQLLREAQDRNLSFEDYLRTF